MKNKVQQIIDQNTSSIISLGNQLFETPELGFKEWKTKEKIVSFLKEMNLEVQKEYCETGFQVTLGQGKPHIGLLAELDAIVTPGHRCSNNPDQAAHSCAHSVQCTIMLGALQALKQCGWFEENKGTVTLFFSPAEEFVDLDFRKKLIEEGKIQYLSGKENMLVQHVFDDIDCLIHLHAMGEYRGYRYNINSELAGFVYKKYRFQGKASHAAVLPHEGINALNMFTLFQSASSMLRETFKEEDKNRVHGILTHGGDSVNTIPGEVVYESYVRSFNYEHLYALSNQLTKTAKCCAQALGGDCIVENTPGYLPFKQSHELSSVIYQNMLQFCDAKEIMTAEQSVAAGDIGDVGCFIPTIQFGHTGFTGTIHGKTLEILETEHAFINPAKIVAMSVLDLLSNPSSVENIKQNFKPTLTLEEYIEYLNK